MALDQLRVEDQFVERVGRSLRLDELGAVDAPAAADDGVAGADQDAGRRIDRAGAVLELADEAVVQAAELRLARLVQLRIAGEELPRAD